MGRTVQNHGKHGGEDQPQVLEEGAALRVTKVHAHRFVKRHSRLAVDLPMQVKPGVTSVRRCCEEVQNRDSSLSIGRGPTSDILAPQHVPQLRQFIDARQRR